MNEVLSQSLFFGVVLSLFAYEIGLFLKRKSKLAIMNPLLVAVVIVVGILLLFHIKYETYQYSAKYLNYFLTPATVSLAIPLYRQWKLLRQYPGAILGGIAAGVMTAMVSVFVLSLLFGLNHEQYVTLLPKSITTAIGMGISEKMGGITAITVAAIVLTGIVGNILADLILKLCKIEDPIAKGLAIGTSAHALGTTKAMELGEIEGAMSSLSIVVAGIMTVVTVSFFATFL